MKQFILTTFLWLTAVCTTLGSPFSIIDFDFCPDSGPEVQMQFNAQVNAVSIILLEQDDCAVAMALPTNGTPDVGTNVGSTEEGGEPIPAGLTSPISSVWYNITTTAPNTSVVIDFTVGSIVDPVIAIYENLCFSPNPPLFVQPITASGMFTACLPAGTYKIQIATDATNEGTYTISVDDNISASPLNENCAGASNEPVVVGVNAVDNICSTDGLVWFEYTVVNGDHVDAVAAAPFTVTNMFLDDCVTPITNTTCLAPGQVIHIEAGNATPQFGNFNLTISESDNPVTNDDCIDAFTNSLGTLTCSNSFSGSGNSAACPDAAATLACGGQGDAGVWYYFTVNGLVTAFDITGNNFEVFTGACAGLTSLGCAGSAALSGIDPDVSGTAYYVLVFHDGITSGSFTAVANPQSPSNDACANAITLAEASNTTGNNACATGVSPGFCNVSGGSDHVVWYQYTTPAVGTSVDVTFTYSGSGPSPATDLGIVVLDACGGTQLFTTCNASGEIFTCVLPNTTLIIGIGSQDGDEGGFTLNVSSSNAGVPANDLCNAAIDVTPAMDCSWEVVAGDNTNSCPESFGGSCNQNNDNTIWYSITLPANAVGIDVRNLTGGAALEVFDNNCSNPANGPTNGQGCETGDAFIALTGGNTYLISVSSAGAFDFEIRTKVPPANDLCSNAVALSNASPVSGTTECATSAGETAAGCDGNPENIVWYTYNVASDVKTINVSITNFSSGGNISAVALDACNSATYYNNDNNNEDCGTTVDMDIDCPIGGTTIYIAVSSSQADEGSFDIEVTETQTIVPANDDCANATDASGPICTPYQVAGNNEFSCPESFDAAGCGLDLEEVVWYEVPLPADATSMDVGINSYSGSGTGFFGVFSDCAGSSVDGSCWINVSSGDPEGAGVNVDISAFAGGSVYIAFGSTGDTGGAHSLDIQVNNTPVNDDPCMPTVFAAGGGTLSGSTECANPDFFDPACSANYDNTVWYEYTLGAGETGVEVEIALGTATGPFGVGIVDQTGNCAAAPTLFPNASSCAGSTEIIKAVCLPANQTVHIIVGTPAGGAGTFDITLTPIIPVPTCVDNDDCANAQDFGTITTDAPCVVTTDCNADACPDVVGSCNGGLPVNNVVWYTVQNDGMGDFISVEVTNATFTNPVIGVFVGPDCNNLTQIGGCTNGGGGQASTGPIDIDPNNPPIAGENYYIAIGSTGNTGGDFDLCIEIIGGCVNDDPCDAVQLTSGVTTSNPASTTNCTMDLPNPNCPGNDINTVWYKYTVPAGSNRLQITINNYTIVGDYSVQVGEYISGTPGCLNQPAPIADNCTNLATLRMDVFCVKENTEYYIQIGSATGMDAGDFDITVDPSTGPVPNDLCSQAQNNAANHIDITTNDYCQWLTVTGTTVEACPEDFIVGACDYSNVPTVWYQINIPNDPAINEMDLMLEDITQGGGMFSLFTNVCDPLTAIGGADCGNTSEVTVDIPVTPGDSYLVAIGTSNDMPGTFEFSVKVYAPPGNDLCQNAEPLSVGSSTMGTTECATNSMDYDFSGCSADLNESDVWYVIPLTMDETILTIDITNFSGAGNYGAAAFYTTTDCAALTPVVVEGAVVEDCSGDKMLEIPVKCLDPAITAIYIKVGSPEDDGDGGNGAEQGTFDISVTNTNPSCGYADECAQVSEVLTPVTPPDGTIQYTACAAGCLEYACPEMVVGDCGFNVNPTVWFQVDTDLDAQQLYVTVTTNGSWDPVFAIYQGDCANLTIVNGGTVNEPILCNTDDTTPEISNVGIQSDANGNPISTYYIAVSADGLVDDPTFDICTATAIGIVTCLGGIPPDNLNHTCDPAATFEVTARSNDPDGSLGLPLDGPFCPGETISLHFDFFYDATATGNDWLQGIVPILGDALQAIDPSTITATPGGGDWYPEGIPQVNENVPNLCTYTDNNGNLVLCNQLCQSCPCNGPLTAGSPLPGGWFWVSNGGGGCANDGTPTTMWGIPGGVMVDVSFDLDLTVKEFADMAECLAAGDIVFAFQTFSDGVTGCWEDPVGECLKDVNQVISYPLECVLPPGVVANPNPKEICSGEDINVNVMTEDGSNLEIEVIVEDNPFVDGENDHTFTGSGTINDVLINNSDEIQCVLYIMRAIDPSIVCPGPKDTLKVIIYPDILVEFEDVYVCEGLCTDISPSAITGGTGNYIMYEWNTGATTPSINVCPIVPTTYIITVTDDQGCTGTGEIEVDVKPKVVSYFDPMDVVVCKDGIEGNEDPITVIIEDGSPNYIFTWSFSPFGLEGFVSPDFVEYPDDTYQVDAENSFELPFDDYELCVEIIDMFGCEDTACVNIVIQGAPDGTLNPTAPLQCGQTIVDLIAVFDQGSSITDIDRFELYDCDGVFLELGVMSPYIFEDYDLEDNNCFILETYNINGCVDRDTLTLNVTLGTPAVLAGDTTICKGETAMIAVTNASEFVDFNWNSGDSTAVISVTPDSTFTYRVTVSDAGMCTDVAAFTVNVVPLPTIQISGSRSFCTGSQTTLQAIGGMGSTYIWTNTANDTISSVASVTISTAGAYTVEVTRNGCSRDSTINVVEETELDINLNVPVLCDNGTDTLFAGAGFAGYMWSIGGVPIANDTSFLEINQAGTYSVTVTDITGCSGADTVTIQNFTTPMATVTDTVEVCRVNNGVGPIFINFNAQVSGSTGTWSDTDLTGVNLTNLDSVSFENIPRGTYSFTFTTNTAMGNCQNVSYVMEVVVIRCPCPVVDTRVIPDQCNSAGNILNLNAFLVDPPNQVGSWSYVSGPDVLVVTNNSVDLSGVTAGTYTVQWTIQTPVGTCPTSSQQSFNVSDAPFAAIVPGNKTLCNEDTGQGAFEVDLNTYLEAGSDAGVWTQTGGPAVDLTNLPTISAIGLNPGDILQFTYTTNSAMAPCTNVSVPVNITVRDCSCPLVNIAVIPPLCNGGTVINLNDYLTTDPPGLNGTWTTNATPNPISGSMFNATGILSGQYTVTFTLTNDPGGNCQRAFTQNITIRRQPVVTVIGSGSPCNTNSTGNDITTVNLFNLIGANPPAGMWTQTGGSPMLTINGGVVEFDGQAIGSTVEFTYTTTGALAPCVNVSETVTVTVIDCNCPNVDLLQPNPMCNTEIDLDLATLEGGAIDPGTWTVTGPGGNVPLTGKILGVAGLAAGNYQLTYTLTNQPAGFCKGDSTVILQISEQRTASVNPNAQACSEDVGGNENVINLLNQITSGPTDGSWFYPDGTPITIPQFADFAAYNPGDMVVVRYVLTSAPPCVDQTYTVTVEILDCACPPIIVTDFETCSSAGVIDLTPYGDAGKPGRFESSEVTITNNTVDVTALGGNYNIDYVIDNPEPNCPNKETFIMTVIRALNPGTAGQTSLCVGVNDVIDLFGLLTDEDAGGVWTETSNQPSTGGAFNPGNGSFATQGQAVGTYRFRYTHLNNPPCPDVFSEVTVTVQNIPPVDAGEAQTIDCVNLTATLGGTAGNSAFDYQWSHDGGQTVPNGTSAITTVNFPGVFTLTVTDKVTGCTSSDQVTIDLSNDIPVADVTPTDVTCFGDGNGSILVSNPVGGTPPYQYSNNGGATFQVNPNFANLGPGNYTVVIRDAIGCVVDLGTFTIAQPEALAVDLGPDQVVKLDTDVPLGITGQFDQNRITNIVWTITTASGDSVFCTGTSCLEFLHNAQEDATICVTISDDNGCLATDCINIRVIRVRDIVLPDIFTPNNNDDVNDKFFVNDNDVERVNRFYIFDRWGNKVFSAADTPANDPSFGWDGKMDGKDVVAGVYVYVIEVLYTGGDNEVETFTGDVTVLR